MSYTPFDLQGKVALVTGGNSGIGLGMAEAMAQAGARVAIWGTSPDKNAAAEERLRAIEPGARAFRCDVSDEAAVERCFAETLETFGRVDGCFANAGVGGRARFDEMSTAEWRRVMSVNLDGLFWTLRAAAAHMRQRSLAGDPGGRLVGTSSLGALCGMRGAEHYAASKGAVISFMQALAVEYARHGVTANSILPGHIETAMTEQAYATPQFSGAILPRIPVPRWGKPEDFGGIAVYLMSDASAYHTGDTLLIDGGFFLF